MEPLAADDPRQVGEYRLLRRLGAGGMGRVYLGRTGGGRTVAVKVVRRELAENPEFRARFRHEVEAARRVGGAWTAPVLDADTEGGDLWVATGYIAGPALTDAVREFGPLPEPAVRTLGAGLAEALAHVHGLGLVHRDVKPSNVLLTLDGPRLIDFGIARALDATTVLTRSGHVFGSPGFMSPEQANGLPAGPASDVFSVGAVLAYAATGRMPFGSGVSAPVLLYRVLHEEPDLSGLAGPLHSLVRDCLAKDPTARPTPGRLRERLDGDGADGDGADAARLGRGDWLPAALAAAVGRGAVRLLDLEGEREAREGTTVAEAARAARAAEAATGVPSVPGVPGAAASWTPTTYGAPGAPGFGPPPPGYGPPTTVPGHGPHPQPPRRRRRYGVAAAVLVAVLLLGGGGYLVNGWLRADRGIVPAKYLGTWTGEIKADNGNVTTVILTIVQSKKSEEKSTIRADTLATGIWCEGKWTLSEASEERASYASREVASSPGAECTANRSIYRLITVQPDGTLHYSKDLGRPEEYIVLRKKG
ncbi:serine/threonine-protein kinase [Kitasatospora sp. NPDC002551]|uniref:serine/threonine-protein kinase n=1 Tax=Kitasatospora sp. NPDC002551 TaxID=3154539 RepID=UPI00332B0518